MSTATTLLFAVAGAFAVGNLYWAQPLLVDIAGSLGVAPESAGLFVTLTQIGYTVGIFFVVPLGDVLRRRRLIPAILVASGIALLSASVASSYGVLLVALALVGVTSVSAQLLAPLAGDLATSEQRGRVLGTITGGVLIGILLSRTVSGAVAGLLGWQAVYVFAGIAAWVFAVVLWRNLPVRDERQKVPYGRLLLSVFAVVRVHPAVPLTLVLSALNFGVFTMFWTAITFLLSAPPFSYPVGVVGLFGLAGLAGALLARQAGSFHDRGWSVPATGIALALNLVALALAGIGQRSVVVLVVAIIVFDVGVQAVTVLSQTRLLSVAPAARSRLNTALVTANFVAGALGSAAATALWRIGGWNALVAVAAAAIAIALAVWGLGRRLLVIGERGTAGTSLAAFRRRSLEA